MARKIGNGLDLQSQKIIHVADGTATDDAATWGQVQSFLAGLAWKPAVRVASTGNVSVASPGASIDGVALSANDRVLLKNQTSGPENGIYTWNGAAVPMTRATDMDSAAETKSATVMVSEGTAGADTAWTQTVDAVTLGSTSLVWAQFGGGGGSYTNGNGLNLSGGSFSIKTPGSSGLTVDGTGVYIDPTIVVRKFATSIGDGTTTTITVTHNLGTRDVQVTVFDNTTFAEEFPDVAHATTNTVTVTYATAPTTNAKRVVVQA